MADGIQGRMTRWWAGLFVILLHVALYRLLVASAPAPVRSPQEDHRVRLVLSPAASTTRPPPSPAPIVAGSPRAARSPPRPAAATITALPWDASAAVAEPSLAQDHWGSPSPPPASSPGDFSPDPLRSRRARLPGGDRGERFRMAPSVSPAKKVVTAIGMLFGGAGYAADPCDRIRENIAGLLPDTSPQGRQRLEEELGRDRDHCRP